MLNFMLPSNAATFNPQQPRLSTMTKRSCEEIDHPATIIDDRHKRLRESSLPGTGSQTVQHLLKNDSHHQTNDPFEADIKKAIALSLADQDGLQPATDFDQNDKQCVVCKRVLVNVSEEAFNRHVNGCLDNGEDNREGSGNSSSSSSSNTEAKASWSSLFRKVPDAFATLMQTTVIKKSRKMEKSSLPSNGPTQDTKHKAIAKRPCPFYKWMQDTPYTVDAFCYGEIDNCKGYFLTHFHSDHYTNLRKSWSHGPIYCSQITANLVRHKIGVSSEYVHPLPMDKEVALGDNDCKVSVTLIDANHCPGAVLFLFKVTLADGQIMRHLHTGDFRANPRMCLHPCLKQPENGPIDTLYLDTTYLHGSFTFPRQALVLQTVCNMAERIVTGKEDEGKPATALKAWLKTAEVERPPSQVEPFHEDIYSSTLPATTEHLDTCNVPSPQHQCSAKILVVVGTYLIGKEKVFYHIAKQLGAKIHVDARKRKIIECLEDKELLSMLTSDPFEAQVHALPIMHLKIEYLTKYLEGFKPHFTSVIAFRPTGWTFRGDRNREDNESRPLAEITAPIAEVKGASRVYGIKPTAASTRTIRIFGVPYSEHSSFRELASFVGSLQIRRIIPTVNMSRKESRDRMSAILSRWQQEKKAPAKVVSFTSEDGW